MKPREVFGVIVRSLGLWEIVSGIPMLLGLLEGTLGAAIVSLSALALHMILGSILLFGADGFVRAAYSVGGPTQD